MQQSAQMQSTFFKICSQFRGTLSQVHGPAAALSFMLDHVNWKLDRNGFLHVTAFLSFPLLKMSIGRITRFLELAWMDRLVIMHSARTKWFHFPDIARTETAAVLAKFADPRRWLLIREIAGAYQTASQKKHWLTNTSGKCEHCGEDDSRSHRFLECPIGSEVRVPYQSLIRTWTEELSLMPDFPVVTLHPDLEAMTLLNFHHAPPVWGSAILQIVADMHHQQHDVHWYTDGSCMNPSSPNSRHAAYAVVLDLCTSDEQRCLVAACHHSSHSDVQTLQVACVARCQGEQDILRAETSAILAIAEQIGYGIIHSDSQTAIHNVQLALNATSCYEFQSCEHVDLLYRLWLLRGSVSITLRKVKSHQHIDSIPDMLQKYFALGNTFADKVAQHACRTLEQLMLIQVTRMPPLTGDAAAAAQALRSGSLPGGLPSDGAASLQMMLGTFMAMNGGWQQPWMLEPPTQTAAQQEALRTAAQQEAPQTDFIQKLLNKEIPIPSQPKARGSRMGFLLEISGESLENR
eukprot:s1286_g9.t1